MAAGDAELRTLSGLGPGQGADHQYIRRRATLRADDAAPPAEGAHTPLPEGSMGGLVE